MPNPATIGVGKDYPTVPLWYATESSVDYGVPIEGQCTPGEIVGTLFTLTGNSVNGAKLYTVGVAYGGTPATRNQLAIIRRMSLAADIDLRDLRFTSDNAFTSSLTLNAGSEGGTYERLSVDHPNANGVDGVTVNTTVVGSVLRFSDVKGGINGIDYGFDRKLAVNNLTVFNAVGDGLEGAGNNGSVTDILAFNNGANDFVNLTLSTCASEDLTGTFTGYTSAEVVDFAGGDYRTKASSALATLGTGGSFIGAFLEAASGITLVVDPGTYLLTGSAVSLLAQPKIAANTGTTSLTGTNVSLFASYKVTANSGTYTLNGADVNFPAGTTLTAEAGTYNLTGANTGLITNRKVIASPTTYDLTGSNVNLLVSYKTIANPGTFALTGSPLNFITNRVIVAEAGTYALTGASVTLSSSGDVTQIITKVTAEFKTIDNSANFEQTTTLSFADTWSANFKEE